MIIVFNFPRSDHADIFFHWQDAKQLKSVYDADILVSRNYKSCFT